MAGRWVSALHTTPRTLSPYGRRAQELVEDVTKSKVRRAFEYGPEDTHLFDVDGLWLQLQGSEDLLAYGARHVSPEELAEIRRGKSPRVIFDDCGTGRHCTPRAIAAVTGMTYGNTKMFLGVDREHSRHSAALTEFVNYGNILPTTRARKMRQLGYQRYAPRGGYTVGDVALLYPHAVHRSFNHTFPTFMSQPVADLASINPSIGKDLGYRQDQAQNRLNSRADQYWAPPRHPEGGFMPFYDSYHGRMDADYRIDAQGRPERKRQ